MRLAAVPAPMAIKGPAHPAHPGTGAHTPSPAPAVTPAAKKAAAPSLAAKPAAGAPAPARPAVTGRHLLASREPSLLQTQRQSWHMHVCMSASAQHKLHHSMRCYMQ